MPAPPIHSIFIFMPQPLDLQLADYLPNGRGDGEERLTWTAGMRGDRPRGAMSQLLFDGLLIEQVLINLLENAVTEGAIEIKLFATN